MYTLDISTTRNGLFEIPGEVQAAVAASGIKEGLATILIPHSTAGITVISRMDELGQVLSV